MADAYTTQELRPKYHNAIVGWQQKNFPELHLLTDNWGKYFGAQTPFRLVSKIGPLRSEAIEVGQFSGRPKFEKASDLRGNMFYTARDIIKAQCSTELGSIQQHRMSLEQAISDEAKYSVMRIMAEELRHAYQMFWVLDHDPTWKMVGHGDVAEETIDLLLGMETGQHVLDAFNISFDTFLDNVVFATVIDLVGKYQLEMQKVFSYAPMARSMGPMLGEEGFHMGTGKRLLKEMAVKASGGEGDHSLADVQKALNKWYPRGLEMFGNEHGGVTTVEFGFKDKPNGQAQDEYVREVGGILELTNQGILAKTKPNLSKDQVKQAVQKVMETHEGTSGVRPEELLLMPDRKFFRKRGAEEIIFQPYDLRGRMLTEHGKPVGPEAYVHYLATVLPGKFIAGREFAKYRDQLFEWHKGGDALRW